MYRDGDFQRPANSDDNPKEDWRPPFIRDYGRIIHSASFRRQQGKTQVFPGRESDFFRNRLTHSLEVAQISEGIAERLNHIYSDVLGGRKIDTRLCAVAGLVHDIGHPPFGHNGERALDNKMKEHGGFEGNAQTLRILSRLEKKVKHPEPFDGDDRAGMNLCYRTLAATIKYDREIPLFRSEEDGLVKGYYQSEAKLVSRIKEKVLRGKDAPSAGDFKTIECQILDIADDIAYSVYDLEDSLKAGFISPASILASDDQLIENVAKEVTKQIGRDVSGTEIRSVFIDIFKEMLSEGDAEDELERFIRSTRISQDLCCDGYLRTRLSSQLVHEFINGVEFKFDDEYPALSVARLSDETRLKVEALKQYTYYTIIYSSRVKLVEYRGTELVTNIFEALSGKKGDLLMPEDVRERYRGTNDESVKARTICDYIAGMTDRYAIELWARLRSDGAESMFKSM